MDQRQLRALAAVGEHRSFSGAARALHTVQSNISTHVSRLERELDVVLVDRATMALTEEGKLVADRARRIGHELDAIASDLASLRSVVSGTVRLGVIGTTARWLVPPLLSRLAEEHPKVRLVVLDATTSTLIPQLVAGRIDVAVVNTPVAEPETRLRPLFEEDRVLVVPSGHPLHGRSRVSFVELGAHELLLEARGTSFRTQLDQMAAAAGIELRSRAEVDGIRLLASLTFAGFGAAILPASAAPGWLDGDWQAIPIDGVARRSVGLATRRKGLLSTAETAVVDLIGWAVGDTAPQQPGIHLI